MGDIIGPGRREGFARPRSQYQMISHFSPRQLPAFTKFVAIAIVGLGLGGLPLAAIAQDSSASSAEPAQQASTDPNAVVATVDGSPITEADLSFVAEELGQQLQNVSQDQIRAILVAQMIDMKLMAKAGREQGLESNELYKLWVNYLTDRAMRRIYASGSISLAVTDEAIKAEYDKEVAAMADEQEVKASHILVATEDDAKAIKAELEAGADFATLAKEKSTDSSAQQNGGELGYFKQADMVKPFADAAFAMEVGQLSDPVQSQFGWHIIKVEDKRVAPKPTLESMTDQISQQLYVAKYREVFDTLRAAATIDIPDATLKAQVDAQIAPQTASSSEQPSSEQPSSAQ